MCAEIRFNDEPVALPDYEVEIRFLDDPPEIHFHDEPVALPEYEPEIRFLDGPVEIFFHGERVDLRSHGVPLPPRGSEVEVWFHDEPVALPDIEPSNEAQDFDAIASALASHNLDDVQLAVSWWLTHYGTEHSRDELTRYLAQAVRNGDIDILDYLLHQEVPFTLHQVGIAIRRKSITMLDMFLRYGWDINEPQSWTTPPLLSLSTVLSDEDLTRYFLRNGADPNARCSLLNMTSLSYAMISASLSTIQLLFDHGGSVHSGQLLHYAAQTESEDRVRVLELLLEKGCRSRFNDLLYSDDEKSMNMMCDTPRWTPLHAAALIGHVDMVQFLLESGCDPAIKDTRGGTALHWAERHGHPAVIEVLQKVTPVED